MTGGADRSRRELERVLAGASYAASPLASGRTGQVLRLDIEGRPPLVAKLDPSGSGGLEVEGAMLRYVADHTDAPVPAVHSASRHLLLMDWRPGTTGVDENAAEGAATALAALHSDHGATFGFESDTRIGGLPQANPTRSSWLEFFAEARLIDPARLALDEGRIDGRAVELIERVATRLPEHASEPAVPVLLHGDLWSGNVLSGAADGTTFLDPALYHGHPEVDLAFATLFGGFSRRFFDAYRDRAPCGPTIDRGFWRTRRDLWNLYPLLVHVRLFGGSYVSELVRTARRFA